MTLDTNLPAAYKRQLEFYGFLLRERFRVSGGPSSYACQMDARPSTAGSRSG